MENEQYDSSGTDDDFLPSHQNRVPRGGSLAGNGRSVFVGSVPYEMHNEMEIQIHILEQEAYSSVLRAFKAQADAISWEREDLITVLRKELRLSDDDHRELLGRVNADGTLCRIRKWRQEDGHLSGSLSTAQPVRDQIPSPTVSASHKRQKTSQLGPSHSLNAPSSSFHPQTVAPSIYPSVSAAKRASAAAVRGKKAKSSQPLPGVSAMKSMQFPSTGPTSWGQVPNRGSSGAVVANDPAEASGRDLIGRKLMTRWPEDNNFYEAIIANYNPSEGRHALVYDAGTAEETIEWVNLKELSLKDIRWEVEDPEISRRGDYDGQGLRNTKSVGRGGSAANAGRGRGAIKGQSKADIRPLQNGIGRRVSDEIEILLTDSVIKEVERVFGASHPNPLEIEKARKVLKEHEHSLIDAITRLTDASDGESEEAHGQSMDKDRGWRNRTSG